MNWKDREFGRLTRLISGLNRNELSLSLTLFSAELFVLCKFLYPFKELSTDSSENDSVVTKVTKFTSTVHKQG